MTTLARSDKSLFAEWWRTIDHGIIAGVMALLAQQQKRRQEYQKTQPTCPGLGQHGTTEQDKNTRKQE